MRAIFLGAVVALVLSVTAQADIIPTLAGAPSGSSPYTWNYMAALTSDESLDPVATNGNSCSNAPCNPPGTFFTIYDFAGYVPGSITATAAGWSASAQPVGKTPQNINPTDNPTLTNLTFTYTGAVLAGPMNFNGFSAQSIYNAMTTGTFSTQATKNIGDLKGTTDQNFGNVAVPTAVTPEPGYLLLLLPVFALFIMWRARPA